MRWNVKQKITKKKPDARREEIISKILKNRGIDSKDAADAFLHPKKISDISLQDVGVDAKNIQLALKRLKIAKEKNQEIIIFGDYDADGITATAILWETLHAIGFKVLPFIPHREHHGYGLSIKAIDDILENSNPDLIITVDNGITAHEAAEYIAKKKIDLIITDHHVASKKIPTSLTTIHSTNVAGVGVAWFFAREIVRKFRPDDEKKLTENTLDLATIGTIADQVPLTNINRSLVTSGLSHLRSTKRIGLLELFSQASFDPKELDTYHINFIIAPRINAMGRMAHGLDSLRLLCTKSQERAKQLSSQLDGTNQKRKDITYELLGLAKEVVGEVTDKVLIIDHADFHEGVIGLVAGRLAETHYRPSIVIGTGEEISKASARSVEGINIIELIRKAEHLLVNAGGHPMAAGFTIKTEKIAEFKKALLEIANKEIDEVLLTPQIEIDCQIETEDVTWDLYKDIASLAPFGQGNRQPVLAIRDCKILEKYKIGKDKNHLKLLVPSDIKNQSAIDALWFRHGEDESKIQQVSDIAFTLNENTWNGNTKLQFMIKDIR